MFERNGDTEIDPWPSDYLKKDLPSRNSIGVCKKCEAISRLFKAATPFVPHYYHRDLERSATEGCPCCQLIFAVIRSGTPDSTLWGGEHLRPDVKYGLRRCELDVESGNRIVYRLPNQQGRDKGFNFEICKPQGCNSKASCGSRCFKVFSSLERNRPKC
jgi:hypothetical protein